MNASFRLPSLHLGTDFDTPVVPLEVPGVLGKGSAPALAILDGANRAPHRLSRMVRSVGLLGIKVANPGEGVRITVRLLADDLSTVMWDRHRSRLSGEPLPEFEHYSPPDVTRQHRLIEVTAQGRPRALAMIALRRPDDGTVRQHVSFEVGADEIGDSGLVMIGLEHPAFAPSWALERELEDSLVGVCVARMAVDPIEPRAGAQASTGRPRFNGAGLAAANPGFFVLNPGADEGPAQLAITARGVSRAPLPGRRAKVKHPVRFARGLWDDRRASTSSPAAVEVVDLQGRTLLDTEVPEGPGGRHEFTVPAGSGPVYVRARKVRTGVRPASVNWRVEVRGDGG